jgi:hypothetical protein
VPVLHCAVSEQLHIIFRAGNAIGITADQQMIERAVRRGACRNYQDKYDA